MPVFQDRGVFILFPARFPGSLIQHAWIVKNYNLNQRVKYHFNKIFSMESCFQVLLLLVIVRCINLSFWLLNFRYIYIKSLGTKKITWIGRKPKPVTFKNTETTLTWYSNAFLSCITTLLASRLSYVSSSKHWRAHALPIFKRMHCQYLREHCLFNSRSCINKHRVFQIAYLKAIWECLL